MLRDQTKSDLRSVYLLEHDFLRKPADTLGSSSRASFFVSYSKIVLYRIFFALPTMASLEQYHLRR